MYKYTANEQLHVGWQVIGPKTAAAAAAAAAAPAVLSCRHIVGGGRWRHITSHGTVNAAQQHDAAVDSSSAAPRYAGSTAALCYTPAVQQRRYVRLQYSSTAPQYAGSTAAQFCMREVQQYSFVRGQYIYSSSVLL
jgi:hypothetical protein